MCLFKNYVEYLIGSCYLLYVIADFEICQDPELVLDMDRLGTVGECPNCMAEQADC